MSATIRARFVALNMAEGWIELRRKGIWTLKHPERKGGLTLSIFPVAPGVAMDLATVRALSRERHNSRFGGRRVLDESSWTQGALFCLATTTRLKKTPRGFRNPFPWPLAGRMPYDRAWTVCDGAYVLEASFSEYDEATFRLSVEDGDAMMRSVRFEGPS